MRSPPSISSFVFIFFTAITHAAGIRQTSNNHSSLDIIQDSKSIHCVPLPGRVSLQACAGAILRLPIDHRVGIFHSGGADDGFKLPVTRTYNECNVVVEIQGGGTDQDMENWLDVGRDAAGMNEECARSVGSYRRYGSAWMSTGELDRMRIRLRPAPGVGDVEGNDGKIADEKL